MREGIQPLLLRPPVVAVAPVGHEFLDPAYRPGILAPTRNRRCRYACPLQAGGEVVEHSITDTDAERSEGVHRRLHQSRSLQVNNVRSALRSLMLANNGGPAGAAD